MSLMNNLKRTRFGEHRFCNAFVRHLNSCSHIVSNMKLIVMLVYTSTIRYCIYILNVI